MRKEGSSLSTSNIVLIGLAVVGVLALLSLAGPLIGIIIGLACAMVAGGLAGQVMRGEGYGLLGNIGLGLVGGILGNVLLGVVGLGGVSDLFIVGYVISGVVGAVILILVVRFFKPDFGR
jgi:uncharacterized membrane protein YeaQ/YmgE (transglycosylase-associated protein family)